MTKNDISLQSQCVQSSNTTDFSMYEVMTVSVVGHCKRKSRFYQEKEGFKQVLSPFLIFSPY